MRRSKFPVLLIAALCLQLMAALCGRSHAQAVDSLEYIRHLRWQAELEEARLLAERRLADAVDDPLLAVMLHLELARIHDRRGLHMNTRPVEAAKRHIQEAEAVAAGAGPKALAAVELGWAEYFYRAEMTERQFVNARRHAYRAVERYVALGDKHGEAEAVHRLGLIAMQRRELADARTLFDRSLHLDRAGGARTMFRGEYERHIGFVDLLEGDPKSAIPHFERSLEARREVGAIDPSLFAASSLASALVDVGRAADAREPILYALTVANKIESPVGRSRALLVLGRLYEQLGDTRAAGMAFGAAANVAESVNYDSVSQTAREAAARLQAD